MSELICESCGEPFTPSGPSPFCGKCRRERRDNNLRDKARKLKRQRAFREGVLMWRTWKILKEYERWGVTRVAFSAVLSALGLKEDCKGISGRQIKDRKIVKDKALKCGWEPFYQKGRLCLKKSSGG